MRANFRRPTSKKEQARVRAAVDDEFQRQARHLMRRMFKLFCMALNERYGFGRYRLSSVLQYVGDVAKEREHDEVFWTHVDERMKQLGMDLQPEDYNEMDR